MEKKSFDEIKNALLSSGYLLENRVLDFFLSQDFWEETNHHFIDSEAGKFREMDVFATKQIDSILFSGSYESLNLEINFVSECINNPVPLALFESKGDREEPTSDWVYQFTNGSEELRESASIILPNSISEFERKIINSFPSRQYCSFTKKKGGKDSDWMASHPDDFHQNLVKIASFVKYKQKQIELHWRGIRPQIGRLDMIIPLIVLQGEMIEVKSQEALEITPVPYYRLKVPYEDYYRKSISIDIITEKYLPEYLDKKIAGIKLIFDDLKNHLSEIGKQLKQ